MHSKFELTDSTDWLPTALPLLAPVESALRCQVCKDFYDTPMITSCSHTFCSLCIRKCLSGDGRCPACREQDQASKLRRNWPVQELVEAFQAARPQVLDLAQKSKEEEADFKLTPQGAKRKWPDLGDLNTESRKSPRQTRSRTLRDTGPASQDIKILDSEEEDDVMAGEQRDSQGDGPDDGFVDCPLECGTRMKPEDVWTHTNSCTGEASSVTTRLHTRPVRSPKSNVNQQTRRQVPLEVTYLAQLNYSLLRDLQLRKKLAELGIPTSGSRELLVRRHMEWVNLYNANADSSSPRSVRELRNELESWERHQGAGASTKEPITKMKGFDAKAWELGNKSQFDDLIRLARLKQKPAKTEESTEGQGQVRDAVSTQRTLSPPPSTPKEAHDKRDTPDPVVHTQTANVVVLAPASNRVAAGAGFVSSGVVPLSHSIDTDGSL